MFESFLLLIDRLIALVEKRQQVARAFWDDFLEPLFTESERAYADYVALLRSAFQGVPVTADRISELERRRDELAFLRAKIRELAAAYQSATDDPEVHDFLIELEFLFAGPNSAPIPTTDVVDSPQFDMREGVRRLGRALLAKGGRRSSRLSERGRELHSFPAYLLLLAQEAFEGAPDERARQLEGVIADGIRRAEESWERLCNRYARLKLKYTRPL